MFLRAFGRAVWRVLIGQTGQVQPRPIAAPLKQDIRSVAVLSTPTIGSAKLRPRSAGKICPFCDTPFTGKPKHCRECQMDLYDEFGEALFDDDQPKPPAAAPIPTAQHYRRPHKHDMLVHNLPIDDEAHIDLGGGKGYTIAIVGVSRRQTALRDLSNGRRERDEPVHFLVQLVPEPTNPVDVNAIRVDILDGAHIGYLVREDAAAYRIALAAVTATGKKGVCRAKLLGGTPDKPSIGARIDLIDPVALLARFGQAF